MANSHTLKQKAILLESGGKHGLRQLILVFSAYYYFGPTNLTNCSLPHSTIQFMVWWLVVGVCVLEEQINRV